MLDLNQNGSLSAEEFLTIPELQQNPLVRRVIDILDTDRNGEVDFQGEKMASVSKCCREKCFLVYIFRQSSLRVYLSSVFRVIERRN